MLNQDGITMESEGVFQAAGAAIGTAEWVGNEVNTKKIVQHEHVRACAQLGIATAAKSGMIVGHQVIFHVYLVATMIKFSFERADPAFEPVYHLAGFASAFDSAMIAVECDTASRGRATSGALVGCEMLGKDYVRVSARYTASAQEFFQWGRPGTGSMDSVKENHEDDETGSKTPHDV